MQYTFFIDVYFTKNLILDLDIILLAAVLRKNKIHLLRMLASVIAADAAATAAVVFLPYMTAVFLTHVIINPWMIFFVFRAKNMVGFLKDLCMGYVSVFLLGGILEWMAGYVGNEYFWYVSQGAVLLCCALKIKFQSYVKQDQNMYTAVLQFDEKKHIEVKAYYDSGNLLKDPYVRKPVHIVNEKVIKKYEEELKTKLRFIPFTTVGSEHGLLEVCTIEKMQLAGRGKQWNIECPVIGISRVPLFQGKEYDMLLNTECFEEEKHCT